MPATLLTTRIERVPQSFVSWSTCCFCKLIRIPAKPLDGMIWSLYANVDTGVNNQHVALGLLLDHTLLRMYSLAKSYSCFFLLGRTQRRECCGSRWMTWWFQLASWHGLLFLFGANVLVSLHCWCPQRWVANFCAHQFIFDPSFIVSNLASFSFTAILSTHY